jgi:integrase/recombinase XerD
LPKRKKYGQATILKLADYSKLRQAAWSPSILLLIDLLWFTGERISATLQLEWPDIFIAPGRPREEILFRAKTRKSCNGKKRSREVPIHSRLSEILKSYPLDPIGSIYLFPSPSDPKKHMSARLADHNLRKLCDLAGLGGLGISTHSFRRTLITRLDEAGVSARVIQEIVGHSSISNTQRYIEVSPRRIKKAIELL